jgi:hypothetical protein
MLDALALGGQQLDKVRAAVGLAGTEDLAEVEAESGASPSAGASAGGA